MDRISNYFQEKEGETEDPQAPLRAQSSYMPNLHYHVRRGRLFPYMGSKQDIFPGTFVREAKSHGGDSGWIRKAMERILD